MRRSGEKLYADLQMQEKIAGLVNDNYYHNISLEIFPDYKLGEEDIGPVVSAISLLGNERPALPLSGFSQEGTERCYHYSTTNRSDFIWNPIKGLSQGWADEEAEKFWLYCKRPSR